LSGELHVEGLEHSFGAQKVLNQVSFSLSEGERLCLLGPSGCGKTTTLQVIAGFLQAQRGSVSVGGLPMDGLPPERRNIGIMFQNYALFPHMTVFENVAFGLRMRRVPKPDIEQRVREALRLVRLGHAAEKAPKQLSGGEQQRIAFARAVVIRPSLLLLDEPFSNLDARLRVEMRNELLDLLRPLRIATVMVTHDQEEAMAIADRVAVMRAGRIEQVGTAHDIYDAPASLFVARFVGESNVFDATLKGGGAAGLQLDVTGMGSFAARGRDGLLPAEPVQMLVRPESVSVQAPGTRPEPGWNHMVGTAEEVVFLGHRTEWRIRAGTQTLTAWQAGGGTAGLRPGDPVVATWRQEDTLIVPRSDAHAFQ
jgi:ABC-type Fe3+/spermidine/putrescine transport system ATPase subunit